MVSGVSMSRAEQALQLYESPPLLLTFVPWAYLVASARLCAVGDGGNRAMVL